MKEALSLAAIEYVESVFTPDSIDGMTLSEITEELETRNIDVEFLTTLICLTAQEAVGVSCDDDAEMKLLDETTFIKDERLGALLDRLEELGYGEAEWVIGICTNPVKVCHWFQGAAEIEEFIRINKLDDGFKRKIELQILEDLLDEVASMELSILGLYPSGYMCTLPVEVSRTEGRLLITINDAARFMDPYSEDQSLTDVRSFMGKLTIFAVSYHP